MKYSAAQIVLASLFISSPLLAQSTETPTSNPRVIILDTIPKPSPSPSPSPLPTPSPNVLIVPNVGAGAGITNPSAYSIMQADENITTSQLAKLSYSELSARIEEAKRAMRTKPLRTASIFSAEVGAQSTEVVRVAFYDTVNRRIDYVVMTKFMFLDPEYSAVSRSENGVFIRVHTVRGNGVNTPVMVFDSNNRPHIPLVVQYPIEKLGSFKEMSYYVSAHPGIVSPEVVNVGRMYVRNVMNAAAQRLKDRGIFVQPKVIDMAEKLALVEHVDHQRFRTEYHPKIYNDVYTLYAMNKGDTYRYSVSSAGAGGMVQMIPATYNMIRSRYYAVGLNPDFVSGMRDHTNASEAMLLYMQMTWSDLVSNSTIFDAINSGIATPEQLMAAGYNSNPAKLPGYIRRGGANWTSLIPRETKIYLQILESVQRHVPFVDRVP